MRRHLAAGALAFSLLATPAFAEQSSNPGGQETIVVTAARLHQMVLSFVGEVTAPATREDQIARWNNKVCPMLAGLPVRQAQFINDRIAQRASQVGLTPGGPGCQVNVLIFVTPDSNRLARELLTDFRVVLDGGREGNMATGSLASLDEFVTGLQPVRWWHVAQTVSAGGIVVRNTTPYHRAGDLDGLSIVRSSSGSSRLARSTRQDFNRAVIIVDATRAQGVRFDALADYLAMVTLAQLDPKAETAEFDTILNLFADRDAHHAGATTLTAWDTAYLEGLYGMRRNTAGARRQEHEIARRMEQQALAASP